jgi:glycerol kinase
MSKQKESYKSALGTICDSYKPGHQVHWIQARVKADLESFDARVEVIGPTKVVVSWLSETHTFSHHNTAAISNALNARVLDYLKFKPDANLLYVQSEEPNELHNGTFSLFYLSSSELSDCLVRTDAVNVSTIE